MPRPVPNTTLVNGAPCTGVDPQDRAFLYGDGLFTSIRVRAGVALLWPRHLQRLQHGALALAMDANFMQLEEDVVKQAAQMVNGTLKVIISRGVGTRGYLPPYHVADIYLQLFPGTDVVAAQAAIDSGLLEGQLGQVMPVLSGVKTLNRLEQVILRIELESLGWPEGLVCDADGLIIEGVYSNCFMQVAGEWWTPPITHSGISGVMRAELLTQLEAHGIAVHVRTLYRDELDQIEALFFCNALTEIVPVARLAGRSLSVDAVTSLMNLLS
jgi:4-amino-4-deoxychorismate lyase